MAKTVFSDTPPQGTIVTADFLNAVNTHRHDGADADGSGALEYAESTGSSNAYVLTLNPALAAHVPGMPIWMKANHTNTGAATINVAGLGAKGLKRADGSDLLAGELQAGRLYGMAYDGTNYQLLSAAANGIGYGQTWQDVKANRVSGTTYYNTTGKPIVVSVIVTLGNTTGTLSLVIDGILVQSYTNTIENAANYTVSGIVPPGGSYVVTSSNVFGVFAELR